MQTINRVKELREMVLPESVEDVLKNCRSLIYPKNRTELFSLAVNNIHRGTYEVSYEIPGIGKVLEANVTTCKNGVAINYYEPYMRRRDPDCLVIGDDDKPTDKMRFRERFGKPFGPVRRETFDWLKTQDLVVFAFMVGSFKPETGHGALLVAPRNTGFFIGGLADLQGMIPPDRIPGNFRVSNVIYLAPPFRHTHFGGKQIVVHNRLDNLYEVFSYNLYPGPSAKKGVYGILLSIGEAENWLTLHGSTVQVVTPYDNITTIMHEGASGSGKSEMLEFIHRQKDGRLLLGENTITKEKRFLALNQGCSLRPITDDMALSYPGSNGYLIASDAEQAWFVRLDHIKKYGTDPHLESITTNPAEPLIFLNLDGIPGATCLIWEHTEDSPGVRCPNPRVILPRRLIPEVINEEVEVHIRNFGIRTPPCTAQKPTFGIVGYLHILPPALAWLWRLVSPRGHHNPSITESEGLSSEGVGSYWPFATGRFVDHANLLLRQIQEANSTRYTLTPNQHVGAWHVSFMPQWIAREYLARRGTAQYHNGQILPARCPLLGYVPRSMQVEGTVLPDWLLRVEEQHEIGEEVYDVGARILESFFKRELKKFLHPQLDALGKRIITCFMDGGDIHDYEKLIPSEIIATYRKKDILAGKAV